MLKHAVRSEHGQVIIMFAVLVPIFLAMLAFVVDIGQTYLENRNTQQVADSMIRTVNRMLRTSSSSGGVPVAEIPSAGVTTYATYEALKDDGDLNLSESVKTTLDNLMENIELLASVNGVTVKETFAIDNTTKDLYYKVEVSKAYNAIMKIASAAESDTSSSSSDATINRIMIIKFDKASNKITEALPPEDVWARVAQTLKELMSALNNAVDENEKQNVVNEFLTRTDETKKQEVIQALANPSSENVNDAVKTLETILGTKPSESQTEEEKKTAEVAKSAAVLAVLDSEDSLTDNQKGKIFEAYLTAKITQQEAESANSTTFTTNAITGAPQINEESAKDVLLLVLGVMENVSDVKCVEVSGNPAYITYADSIAEKMYHKISICSNADNPGSNYIIHSSNTKPY